MPGMLPEHVLLLGERYKRLLLERANFDTLWQEIGDYVIPSRNRIQEFFSPGIRTTNAIYDSTALNALTIATSALHSSLTPSTLKWFSLRLRDEELMEDNEIAAWLDDSATRMFAAFNNSNFDSEMQEIASDIFAFGTACLYVTEREASAREDFSGLRFEAVSPATYVVSENADGLVDVVFRARKLSVRAAAQIWGAEKLSEKSREKLRDARQDELIEIIHAVVPRPEGDDSGSEDVLPRNRAIASIYFESAEKHLIEESGYHEMPYMVPRWRKINGEMYGRSLVMNALPDIRTLNKAVELRLKAWELAVNPPVMVRDRGVVGDVRMAPRGMTFVRDMDAVREFITQARFDVANFSEEQLRNQINAALLVDQLQLANRGGTPISATEAAIRFEAMQRILGPTVTRLGPELLSPLINRVFRIMMRRGQLQPPPQGLLDATERTIDVQYEGPLARTQRQNDVDSINRFLQTSLPLAQAHPEVLDVIDFDAMARVMARASGVPAGVLLDKKAVDKIRQARAQAQQQQAQQEQMASLMGTVAKAGPLIQSLRGSTGEEPTDGAPTAV